MHSTIKVVPNSYGTTENLNGKHPKVKALPLLKDALPRADQQRLMASYFDTPDKYLWKRGLSLRFVEPSKAACKL